MLVSISCFAAAASAQTTVTLSTPGTQINADLTIQGGASGMTDFSAVDSLASKVSSESYTRRILLKVDTQNNIPAGATIQSARLYLVLKSAESSENRPLTAYNVAQSFVSGETNWYYFRSGQAWASRGGDFNGSFGTTYVNGSVGSTYAFDLTSLVQRAVNGDFGSRYTRVALVDTGGNTSGNFREFYSTRAANAAVRPRLVVTYSSGSTTTAAPPPPSTSTRLRVMQWNIHKTKGSDGLCNPDRTTNTIVAQNPDVVSLNEVNFFSGDCAWNFDMGLKLRDLMQQKTGVTWYIQSVNPNGVGNVLLSRLPLISASSYLLDYGRGVAQIGVSVNGRTVNLFSTHIEYTTASWRPIQIAEALRWVSNFAEPRIMMGDFNTWPNTTDYYTLTNVVTDGWAAALSAGTASSYNGTGNTEGLSRIDYVWLSKNYLSIGNVSVPNTIVNGIRPSDHDPIVSNLNIK
jgi:endonuclease/exonuclease/phosphatase family metal-dependent hydrolase